MGNAALGGMPFLIANRIIAVAAAGTLEVQRNYGTYKYRFHSSDRYVNPLKSSLLRVSSSRTVLPGDFLELELDNSFRDCNLSIEPRSNSHLN